MSYVGCMQHWRPRRSRDDTCRPWCGRGRCSARCTPRSCRRGRGRGRGRGRSPACRPAGSGSRCPPHTPAGWSPLQGLKRGVVIGSLTKGKMVKNWNFSQCLDFFSEIWASIQTKKGGKESTPFNRIHKYSFGGLGADTLTFCKSTPFSGEAGEGGLSAFSMAEFRVPISLWRPANVWYVQNIWIFLQICLIGICLKKCAKFALFPMKSECPFVH